MYCLCVFHGLFSRWSLSVCKRGTASSLVRSHGTIPSSLIFFIRLPLLKNKNMSVNKESNSIILPPPFPPRYGEISLPYTEWYLQNQFPGFWITTLEYKAKKFNVKPHQVLRKKQKSLAKCLKERSTHSFLIILYILHESGLYLTRRLGMCFSSHRI